jgi:hypothetical protein
LAEATEALVLLALEVLEAVLDLKVMMPLTFTAVVLLGKDLMAVLVEITVLMAAEAVALVV